MLAALCAVSISISQAEQFDNIERVVLISIDGLRADVVNSEHMPLLDKRLRQGGRYSFNARNVLPSQTLPNHAAMLTGLDTDHHQVDFNYDPAERRLGFFKPEFIHPTLFNLVHAQGGSTAAFIAKSKLSYLLANASLDSLFIESKAKKAEYLHGASSGNLVDAFMQRAPQARYTFTFFHFREADSIGHDDGWMSDEYLQTINAIDRQLERLLDFVVRPNTAIVITADHGGNAKSHKEDKVQNRTIPWLVLMPGQSSGQALTSPINIVDTAPTIAKMLRLEWPGEIQGKTISLGLE